MPHTATTVLQAAQDEVADVKNWFKKNLRSILIVLTVLLVWRYVLLQNVFPNVVAETGKMNGGEGRASQNGPLGPGGSDRLGGQGTQGTQGGPGMGAGTRQFGVKGQGPGAQGNTQGRQFEGFPEQQGKGRSGGKNAGFPGAADQGSRFGGSRNGGGFSGMAGNEGTNGVGAGAGFGQPGGGNLRGGIPQGQGRAGGVGPGNGQFFGGGLNPQGANFGASPNFPGRQGGRFGGAGDGNDDSTVGSPFQANRGNRGTFQRQRGPAGQGQQDGQQGGQQGGFGMFGGPDADRAGNGQGANFGSQGPNSYGGMQRQPGRQPQNSDDTSGPFQMPNRAGGVDGFRGGNVNGFGKMGGPNNRGAPAADGSGNGRQDGSTSGGARGGLGGPGGRSGAGGVGGWAGPNGPGVRAGPADTNDDDYYYGDRSD